MEVENCQLAEKARPGAGSFLTVVNVVNDFKPKKSDEAQGREQFHEEVADGEFGAASAAAAAKPPVTDQGQVVVPTDRLEALATARARPPQALFERHAEDADVE